MTEEIINAIIAGIGSDDDPTQQALAIVDNLQRHGYVIASQQDADDREGMNWWNALSDDDRKKWVQPSGRAVDAWRVYKSDNRDGVREAARHVLEKFKKDEEQGYRSKDRQFAIAILGKAFEVAGDEQSPPR